MDDVLFKLILILSGLSLDDLYLAVDLRSAVDLRLEVDLPLVDSRPVDLRPTVILSMQVKQTPFPSSLSSS